MSRLSNKCIHHACYLVNCLKGKNFLWFLLTVWTISNSIGPGTILGVIMHNNVLISSYIQSDWFGRAIIIFLFMLSIYAWAIIALKILTVKNISAKKNELFKILNRSHGDILSIYQRGNPLPNAPFQNLYETIAGELNTMLETNTRIGKPKKITSLQVDTLFDLADCTIANQIIVLEKYLIVLATIVSISPLMGLLGTVWGILIAFAGIGNANAATLAVIGPGMAEALVTTVAGLLVAIPALIGYNWITNRIQTITRELENFSTRILSYVQSIYCSSPSAAFAQRPAAVSEEAEYAAGESSF